MEQLKAIHYEIQFQKSDGRWIELPGRPKTEEEIPELRDRARIAHPGEKIRAVKVTTTVTLEEVSKDSRAAIPGNEFDARGLHHEILANELLQDCD